MNTTFPRASLLAAAALALAACHSVAPPDTRALDNAGMSYDSVQQLKSLEITSTEIAQIAQAKEAGMSDAGCIEIARIYHDRSQHFDAGDAAAGLLQAGASEATVLEIARLGQLNFGAGELQAMRLAGLSDAIVLEVARHRAAGKPVLSGASLAKMKNTGMRDSTLLQLVRLGAPDSDAAAIISSRRHGASDAEILRHY